jgi:exodeoxyribonuclease VII large subunit
LDLDHTAKRLRTAMQNSVRRRRLTVEALAGSRALSRPLDRIRDIERSVDDLSERLRRSVRQRLTQARSRLEAIGGHLHALSPLKVLSRGYSLTRLDSTRQIVRRAGEVRIGERIETILSQGKLRSVVDAVELPPDPQEMVENGNG